MPIGKNNLFIRIFPSFLPFFYSIWLEMIFFKECLIKTVDFVCNSLISLVKKSKGLVSGFCHKYSGFIAWYVSIKATLTAKPILLIPAGIALYYVYYYLYWAWWLGWRLAFAILRARFLACLHHTVRLIETTVIGKVIFGLSLALLSHSLGYAALSPAHLHALLTEIIHIRNYMPPVLPLEPYACH